jgi:hypothetical protein
MKKTTATIIGFLVSPLIAAILGILITPLGANQEVASRLGLLPIFYFFSILATLTFGVPIFFLLSYLKAISWWSALGAGVVIGILVAVVLRLPDIVQIRDFMSMIPMGVASALGFWLIWRRGQ